ncbi:terminase large subunit [Streptomyces sp. DHE17-7]|uniref:terminase large subunit n=1 Tax=Streptomyces sp. DHE17-7 TaxID=2759949 RepID=UPI000EDFC351|nr:terminase TerL endonuclease subunit [Streptomyces sp. DHE17-7]MBJ6623657.1 terminase large subunit [Streptomyces sp. DHE17-7]RIH58390.1 terminase large subunit [Streptomyces sp. SHP22-7]RIH58421.1 terminase large subunit [Streptomyces sp. SHP22-7]
MTVSSTEQLSLADLDAGLPVPRAALHELGLTDEDIDVALESRPDVVAFHADRQPGAFFSVEAAKRAKDAIESFKHTKGRWGGTPLKLMPWQTVWVIAPIFGWLYVNEELGRAVRVIRAAWVEVPRKNGKSTLSSGVALTLLAADREIGPEVYTAGVDREQASRIFNDAKQMAMSSRVGKRAIEPKAAVLVGRRNGGILRALSRVAEAAHGLNVSGGVVDEVHVHKSRDLIEAIETGTGAREQPLILYITTADEGTEFTIYDEKHTYTVRVAEDVVEDPAHYGVIWRASEEDDPFSEATWHKANPGLRYGAPTLKSIQDAARKASTTPSAFPGFCRLYLNRRMNTRTRWMPMPLWDANGGELSSDKRLKFQDAWGGLDLSAVSDLSAWVMVVKSRQPGIELEIIPHFWVPEERVDDLTHELQVPLRDWADAGLLHLTEGDAIDYATIEDQILKDSRTYRIKRIGYDRMFAGGSLQRIEANPRIGEVVPINQTYLGQSPAVKETERLLRSHALRHDGHKVLRWNAQCAEVIRDGNDNLRLVKPKRGQATARIDGMAALVNAVDGYLRRKQIRDDAATA